MSQRDHLLDQIRRLALRGMGERQTDGQLLELFISQRDESAFALLLRRHGAMVWSVCRRILGNPHDADDAFQAAFLVLVRKADSIRPRESVGNWLYGVAHRTALEARRRIARRRAKEQPLRDVPLPESKPEEPWHELGPILDRELSRLADKYRLPIVLCDLEGRSRKEVARQLAIPEGTLSSRLNTGRKKLAARLARYGFTISAAALGTLLTEKTAIASLSLTLLSATTKAAMAAAAGPAAARIVSVTVSTLTEGVLKTMFIAKIKTATLVVCSVAALGAGTGGVYYQTRVGAADSPQADRVAQDNPKKPTTPEERDIDKLKRQINQLTKALADARDEKVVQSIEMRALREMLERERDQKSVYRAKLNDFVKGVDAEAVPRSSMPERKPDQPSLVGFKDVHELLRSLDRETESLRESYKREMRALLNRERDLETEMFGRLAALEAKRDDILKKLEPDLRSSAAFENKPAQKQQGGDKLDQILERLERLEKRLDRLEKGRE